MIKLKFVVINHKIRVVLLWHWIFLVFLAPLTFASPALAQNCTTPVNINTNGAFDASNTALTGYSSIGNWQLNKTLDPGIYGTIYNTHTAVTNAAAAPTGGLATNYPASTLNSFAMNENDAANDSLTLAAPLTGYGLYNSGQLRIWFDAGWRQAGGTGTLSGILEVRVNNTPYMRITTISGHTTGNAAVELLNGATFGAAAPTFTVSGGAGVLSQWNTVNLIVPYTATTVPVVSFVMSGGSGIRDDFALDRIYVPMCLVTPVSVLKSSTVVSDAVSVSNPKAIPNATIRYCIRVTNPAGNPTVETVNISDTLSTLPGAYVASSLRINGTVTGSTCNADGVTGGSFGSGTVSATLANLLSGETRTIYFDMIIS
jgi:hypothetical protein